MGNEGEELRSNLKETVGRKVIRPVMQDLCNQQNHEQKEWLVNAVSLLQSLASNVTNCNLMKDDWKDVKKELDQSKVSSLDVLRDKISGIETLLKDDDLPQK